MNKLKFIIMALILIVISIIVARTDILEGMSNNEFCAQFSSTNTGQMPPLNNIKCGKNNFCVNVKNNKPYCYGSTGGCLWGSNDCTKDSDCAKYNMDTALQYTDPGSNCANYRQTAYVNAGGMGGGMGMGMGMGNRVTMSEIGWQQNTCQIDAPAMNAQSDTCNTCVQSTLDNNSKCYWNNIANQCTGSTDGGATNICPAGYSTPPPTVLQNPPCAIM